MYIYIYIYIYIYCHPETDGFAVSQNFRVTRTMRFFKPELKAEPSSYSAYVLEFLRISLGINVIDYQGCTYFEKINCI